MIALADDDDPYAPPPGASGGPRRTGNLSESVYDSILGRIVSGALPSGTLLPREGELAIEFGISRTVLREALARLRYEGLIVSKRGTGNRVVGSPTARPSPIFPSTPPHSIAELQACFEFRLGIEPNIAALAAERANRSDLEHIEASAKAFERAVEVGELGAEQDIAFHTAITRASQNSFYVRTIAAIAVPVEIGMRIARTLSTAPPPDRLATTIDEHRAILAALATGAPEQARAAMRRHIEASMERVFGGPDPAAY
jgi:GntR family transcriptional regulator, transcriptional repressor for pyruvate dehydrogenase complex